MEIGNKVTVKKGATKWMKERNYWINDYPKTIDEMEGIIVENHTTFRGDDCHFGVKINGIDSIIGIHPQWLETDK